MTVLIVPRLTQGGTLRLDLALGKGVKTKPTPSMPDPCTSLGSLCLTQEQMKRGERENTLLALEWARWKLYGPGGAAELLGLKPNTLAARLRVMGIQRPN